jgi:hypothetical protein
MKEIIEDYIKLKQKQAIKEYKDKNNSSNLLGIALFFILVTGFVYLAHENIKLNKPAIVNLK